jgi:hypothetical protein
MEKLEYICDAHRHLICLPYTVENLHRRAKELGIHRGWYHPGANEKHPHYDIPKKRVREIMKRCRVVTSKEIVGIMLSYGRGRS